MTVAWKVVALGATAFGLSFFSPTVRHHVAAAWTRTQQAVVGAQPDSHAVEVARQNLKTVDGQIKDQRQKLDRLARAAAEAEVDAENVRAELEDEKTKLARGNDLLEKCDKTAPVVNGRPVSRDQLQADVAFRLDRCKTLDAKHVALTKVAADRRRGVDEGRKTVARAEKVRDQLLNELEAIKVRLASARDQEAVAAIEAATQTLPLGPDSDLGKAMDELRRRVDDAEHNAGSGTTRAGPAPIDWSTPADLSQSVRSYLDGNRTTTRRPQ